MTLIKRILAAACAAAMLTPAAAAAAPLPSVTVIVGTAADADAHAILADVPGASLICEYSLIDAFAAEVPRSSLAALADAKGVTDVSLSATFSAPAAASTLSAVDPSLLTGNDTAIRAEDPLAGQGTVIAVLDSGFDVTHPVFAMPEGADCPVNEENREALYSVTVAGRRAYSTGDSLWINEKIPFAYDYDSMDTGVSAISAHGTHVAAMAAGSAADGGKLNGTAPGAQLLLMKVFDDTGENCREFALINAVQDAVAMGADVINLSLGSPAASGEIYTMTSLTRALQTAESKGVLIVCAMGNDAYAGIEGLASDLPRASDPDYGLPSEPAVMPQALAVASAANSVIYAPYISAGDKNLFYSESYEVSIGKAQPLSTALGGKSLTLLVIPGIGTPQDYENMDVSGCAALIMRGEITFEDKVRYAAEAGAAMVILYDPEETEPFLISVGAFTGIPAAVISREDGAYLAALDGTSITVSAGASAFPASGDPVSSFSSRGPTAELALKPDLSAVGSYVISAIPGGEYGIMSGTSMATPQISGLAVRALSTYRTQAESLPAADRASLWRSLLISAAVPMEDESGHLISPRAQGGGLLTEPGAPVILAAEGGGTLSLGDGAQGGFSMNVRILSLSDADASYNLSASLITDAAAPGEDGIWYITGSTETVPHTLSVSGEHLARSGTHITVTVPAGGEVDLTLTLTPDAEYVQKHSEIFGNGFYLEGFVTLTAADGAHAASLPYLAFAGKWIDAPMLDALDADGKTSYYGENLLCLATDGELITAGESPEGVFSSLFAFSPNEDDSGDSVALISAPLRNIAQMDIDITDADGAAVYRSTERELLKAYVGDGSLLTNISWLWDGSDGINSHFHWEDGEYTVTLTLYSYAGGMQIFRFPLVLDNEKPTLASAELTDGVLTASFRDNHYLKEMRIYLPGEDGGKNRVDSWIYLPHNEDGKETRDPHAGSISAEIPADVKYVYISAEDYAGNVTVVRWYI